jgi:DNA repair photolyase
LNPYCPGNKFRLKAIKEINDAGIQSAITMTPLLPLDNPEQFASDLLESGIKKFIVQPFHATKGKFAAGTREEALKILEKYNWSDQEYNRILKILLNRIPNLMQGKEGFSPI